MTHILTRITTSIFGARRWESTGALEGSRRASSLAIEFVYPRGHKKTKKHVHLANVLCPLSRQADRDGENATRPHIRTPSSLLCPRWLRFGSGPKPSCGNHDCVFCAPCPKQDCTLAGLRPKKWRNVGGITLFGPLS